MFADIKVYGQY